MKSHIPMNRKMQEELCTAVWEDNERCINTNGALLVVALRRYAGWGKKKMQDFIKVCNEVQDEFHGYEIDGTFDIEFEKAVGEIGLDVEQLLPKPINFMEERRKRKREREEYEKTSHVSKATAEAMRIRLMEMKEAMKSPQFTNISEKYDKALNDTKNKGDADNG